MAKQSKGEASVDMKKEDSNLEQESSESKEPEMSIPEKELRISKEIHEPENIDEKSNDVFGLADVSAPLPKQRLALFYKRFVLSRPYANIAKTFNKIYEAGSYVVDEEIINELIEKNAPVGIFERVD